MKPEIDGSAATPWNRFRSSRLWRVLRGITPLRSFLYLLIEARQIVRESRTSSLQTIDADFTGSRDPWNYETSPMEQERFVTQTELLDRARGERLFTSGLEIGCAEGLYTEVLAARCETLLVLDLSPTALARARSRRAWSDNVRFTAFDLRRDEIPGSFDLIVIAGVLEYFSDPRTFFKVRKKLTSALKPGGLLLLETTSVSEVVENAWWGRWLIRGKWINEFISRDHSLAVVSEAITDSYSITLFRKVIPGAQP